MRQRIVIIGGVASGPAAAAHAQRVDPQADVVLFEEGPDISYGACELPYYIGDLIPRAETLVVLTPDEFEQSRKARVRVQHRVLKVDPKRGRIEVRNTITGQVSEEHFDKLILATGARARLPDIPGSKAPNVFAIRKLTEARRLKDYLKQSKVQHAVILGGGYIGVEIAEALHSLGKRVTILEPHGMLLHSYLDADLCAIVTAEVRRHSVAVRQERAVEIKLDSTGLAHAVRTDRGEMIGCQVVIAAIGTVPNTELAAGTPLALGTTGAFTVDVHMRTNLPNVWACGDCIEVKRILDERNVYLPLAPTAFRTSRVAATNAARKGRGGQARFAGVVGASGVKAFSMEAASVGLKPEEAQSAGFDIFTTHIRSHSRVAFYPGAEPLHVALLTERRKGRLLGASLIGKEGAILRANVLVPCLRNGLSVHDIKDMDLIYTPPSGPSLDPLIVAANKASKQLTTSS